MNPLPHTLERTVLIRARRETVFAHLAQSDLWASWWGAGSTIDARVGGRLLIRHPNGVEVHGEVLEVETPSRVVFSYQSAGQRDASRVTITLDAHAEGTRLRLTHDFAEVADRDAHVQGWRYQLSVFTNRLADAVNHNAEHAADQWFAAWSEPDASRREPVFAALAAPGVHFADRFSCISSLDDLQAHIAAVHRFMPGLRLVRRGPVRHCQWRVLADWTALGADGAEMGHGTNVFDLDADGRLSGVTGFWN